MIAGFAPAFTLGSVVKPSKGVDNSAIAELDQHTISDVGFTALSTPGGKNSRLGIQGTGPTVHIAVLSTDKGARGQDMTHGGPRRAESIAEYVKGK